jgi:hypothetical protein
MESNLKKNQSARDRLLAYFKSRVGEVIDKDTLREVAQIAEWARRIRELKDEYGWNIESFRDASDLKPGQYRLKSLEQGVITSRTITTEQRQRILQRDNYMCQYLNQEGKICGLKKGDPHPYNPKKRVNLQIDHIIPITLGGSNSDENLRAFCNFHNALRANLYLADGTVDVLMLVRKLPLAAKREVYEYLKQFFEGKSNQPTA